MNTRTKPAAQPKYRPVLTAAQILHILTLAKTESPISSASISLIATLAPFQAKIENAGIAPAYTTSPVVSATSLEGLGAAPLEDLSYNPVGSYNKEEYWERAYKKYSANPVACSLEEIHAAKEHMYLHELMSAEEVVEFEAASIGRDSNGIGRDSND